MTFQLTDEAPSSVKLSFVFTVFIADQTTDGLRGIVPASIFVPVIVSLVVMVICLCVSSQNIKFSTEKKA